MWQATNSKQFTDVLLDERESTDFRSRSSVTERCTTVAMNAFLTSFEQVFAVLHFLSNLPDALQKSTEQSMDETRKNLAALSEQIAEGMAEYA